MPKGVVCRVEHGEAGMVLGGEHDVADAGQVGQPSPVHGMEVIGVEGFGKFAEEAVSVLGRGADQGVADDYAELTVHAPMDEEAEALIAEPVETLLLVEGAYFGVVCGGGGLRKNSGCEEEEE